MATDAFDRFEEDCFNSQERTMDPTVNSYTNCDVSEGAYSRKYANINEVVIQEVIDNCTGENQIVALNNAGSNYETSFTQFMQELGSPLYMGTPGAYSPDHGAILYPAIRFERSESETGISINACAWQATVFQRAPNPTFFFR